MRPAFGSGRTEGRIPFPAVLAIHGAIFRLPRVIFSWVLRFTRSDRSSVKRNYGTKYRELVRRL